MSSLLDRLIADGCVDDVVAMLDAGAILNGDDAPNWTPLHSACEHVQPAIIRLLVSRGADINRPDQNGWTPLHNAIDIAIDGAIQCREPEINWECVGLFLDLGADSKLVCAQGKTPFNIIDDYGVNAREYFDRYMASRCAE